MRLLVYFAVTFLLCHSDANAWKHFWRGKWIQRQHTQNLEGEKLPPDQWFEQKLDHFDILNQNSWKQVIKNRREHLETLVMVLFCRGILQMKLSSNLMVQYSL